ncbi:16S rRNA processing protein RimM [Campylobacter sp. TTU-622]|uniref:ribosome maturation factor RimM n=1 Tax=Campylobacter sp. TTU-622 TaxID=2800583 RepID=UPI001908B635|nr:ribosome maturation factor RimM [Campylobacter sp. TTU-622]MBK1972909.1 16S rRNA processing protein RimM [Campylobacter sp. TTU-622]
MNEKTLIQVAKLGRTVGLKGYIKLYNLSDFPTQFKKDNSFYINKKEIIIIKDFNYYNSTILFAGYEDLNKAKKLTNLILYQSIEQTRKFCKLEKNEFFYFDILESEVYDDKQKLGNVCNIIKAGPSYLLEIQTDEKLLSKNYSKTFFIPYVDKYIQKVDINKHQIFCSNEAILILENS